MNSLYYYLLTRGRLNVVYHVFLVGNNAKFQFRFGCLYCILHHLYIVMFLHVFDISHVL